MPQPGIARAHTGPGDPSRLAGVANGNGDVEPDAAGTQAETVRAYPGAHRIAGKATGPRPAAGASSAFAELHQEHRQPLFRLAALLTADGAAADAVVADAFVALHRNFKAVGGSDRAWRYLLRMVILGSRRAARQLPACPGAATDPGSGEAQPGRPVTALMAALSAMPQRQREAVALTCYLELSEDETAAVLGIRRAGLRRLLALASAALGPSLPAKSP